MNDIYQAPLLTSWPKPFSGENLKECFSIRRRGSKYRGKNSKRVSSVFSYFFSLFATSYWFFGDWQLFLNIYTMAWWM